jgi:hypothetical protein
MNGMFDGKTSRYGSPSSRGAERSSLSVQLALYQEVRSGRGDFKKLAVQLLEFVQTCFEPRQLVLGHWLVGNFPECFSSIREADSLPNVRDRSG